jgi:VanZ family protein
VTGLLLWLSKRRAFAALLVASYFAAVVFPHKEVSRIFEWMAEAFSFKVYNSALFAIFFSFMVVLWLFILKKIWGGEQRRAKVAFWLFTAALVIVSYEVLIVASVEAIHFIQYAFLAIPVFALTLRFGETVFWTTLMGALDEAYQYFLLYADNSEVYFDFNDVVLNLIGAGIGVVMIYTLSNAGAFASPEKLKCRGSERTSLLVAASLILAGLLLVVSGVVTLYPKADASEAQITLSRKPAPSQFWEKPKRGKPFHILHPVEGIVLAALLIPCYSFMDRVKQPPQTDLS